MKSHTPLFNWLVRHAAATLVLMAVSFVVFGLLSVNLVIYVSANANLLLNYGWDALKNGGLQQLIELWLQVFAAIGTYLSFKLSEHALIERIAHQTEEAHHADSNQCTEVPETPLDRMIH
jgi:hypothetical protein